MLNQKPDPELQALLEKIRDHVMTPEEREAQRESWARGELGIGTDQDEERWKREHGY